METIKFKGLTAEERLNLDMPEDLFQEMKEDPKVKEYLELEKNKKSNSRSVELYLYIIKKYVDKTKGLTEVNLLLEEVTLIPERLIFLINLRKLTLKKLIEKFWFFKTAIAVFIFWCIILVWKIGENFIILNLILSY